MKIYLSYRERMAGLFVLIAIVGVVLFIIGAAVQNRWFLARVTYHTQIVHGDGLRQGSPILLSGIEVGEVGELRILADNRVDVELLVLEKHAHRVRTGTYAHVRRLLGIGEKRIHLVSDEQTDTPLAAGALLPAREPIELLDAVADLDLGLYLNTLNRTVAAMEVVLIKLEEEDRLARMMEAFDQMGPTMVKLHDFIERVDEPVAELFETKAVRRTFIGASRVFNDPNTRKFVKGMAQTFEPDKMKELIERTEKLIVNLDTMVAEGGHLSGTLEGFNNLVNDGRADRLLTSMERLTDDNKIEALVDNMGVLAKQAKTVAPQIPTLTKEMVATFKEAVVVLKALQKTWMLGDESDEARDDIKKGK